MTSQDAAQLIFHVLATASPGLRGACEFIRGRGDQFPSAEDQPTNYLVGRTDSTIHITFETPSGPQCFDVAIRPKE